MSAHLGRSLRLSVTARWIQLLACVALAAAQVQPDPVSRIRAVRERSNRALAMHNIKSFTESLAEDFVIVRGNGVFVPSRQAYIRDFEADFRNPDSVRYERIPDKIEISSVSPLAAEHGHWTATLPNGKRAYSGTYLAMWRRGKTEWQIRSELFVLLACADEAACAVYRK
jgi:ketosteroid isomerase-like protein